MAKCAAQTGGTFDGTGLCTVAAGQIYDPYVATYVSNDQGAGALRPNFIPYNNMGAYASPGNPKLRNAANCRGPGNLIDPVAQNMMKLYPDAQSNMPNGTIYDNWIASGASSYPNDQYDIKIDYRFNEKNLLSAQVFATVDQLSGLSIASTILPIPAPAAQTGQGASFYAQRYAYLQPDAVADHNPRLHARHGGYRCL